MTDIKTPPGTVPLWECANPNCSPGCWHNGLHEEAMTCRGFCFPKHHRAKCEVVGWRVIDQEVFDVWMNEIRAETISANQAR